MPFFLDRTERGPDPWVAWKVRLFFLGAAVGLVGMATGLGWLVFVGIAVLLVGVLLRVLPSGTGTDAEAGREE